MWYCVLAAQGARLDMSSSLVEVGRDYQPQFGTSLCLDQTVPALDEAKWTVPIAPSALLHLLLLLFTALAFLPYGLAHHERRTVVLALSTVGTWQVTAA